MLDTAFPYFIIVLLVCPPANSSAVVSLKRHYSLLRKSILATRQDAEADSAIARALRDDLMMNDDTRVDDNALMPCC